MLNIVKIFSHIILINKINMAFYTSGIKTSILDANFDKTNFQTTFTFMEDTLYLPNLRLLNVGVVGSNEKYNELVGSYGVIRSIALYDGNTLLDQVLECGRWLGWKNFNSSNDSNKNLNNVLSHNALGFTFQGQDTTSPSAKVRSFQEAGSSNTTETTAQKGWLSLKSVMPFLDAHSGGIPTNIYKRLRLVVQYSTDKDNYIKDTTSNYSSIEPVLVADEMVDSSEKSSMMSNYKGVNYVGIEHDRVVVPAVNPTVADKNPKQEKNFLVNGFTNKKVNRMLLVNTPTQQSTWKNGNVNNAYSNMRSVHQLEQPVQVRVNGQNLYPGNGITRPNQRLARLTDTWGTVNSVSNDLHLENASNHFTDIKTLGQLDYQALNLAGRRIQELQVQYSRKGDYDDTPAAIQSQKKLNQQLILNMYGEVQKSVNVSGGRYVLGYL